MKLDRNINGTGRGKYGLINNRKLEAIRRSRADLKIDDDIARAVALLEKYELIEWGEPGTEGEFFVIKLRDENADAALRSYADSALFEDEELATDVYALAGRAGAYSPFCKKPD